MAVRALEARAATLIRLPGPQLRQVAEALVWLGGVGLAAIGASGVLAYAMGTAFGKSFVAGDPSGTAYTASRCRDFFEYAPHAHTCEQAAIVHHYGEIVDYRLAAGVLGLIVLAAWWFVRRRTRLARDLLPDGFAATIGLSLTGVGAALLVVSGLGRLAFDDGRGAGGDLSGGVVSFALAAWFALSVWRVLAARSASSR
jgi:hypothetical protein